MTAFPKIALLAAVAAVALSGCGYSSRESEAIGQPKKLIHQTPIFCSDRVDLDMAMGVLRNGTGSIAEKDTFLTVPNEADVRTLTRAVSEGKLVRVKYDALRFPICWQFEVVTSVEVLD